jgi:hypothetical protein
MSYPATNELLKENENLYPLFPLCGTFPRGPLDNTLNAKKPRRFGQGWY